MGVDMVIDLDLAGSVLVMRGGDPPHGSGRREVRDYRRFVVWPLDERFSPPARRATARGTRRDADWHGAPCSSPRPWRLAF
jgi:hypothetical protein